MRDGWRLGAGRDTGSRRLGAFYDPDQRGDGQQARSSDQSPIPQTRPIAYRRSRFAERLAALPGRRTMLAQETGRSCSAGVGS